MSDYATTSVPAWALPGSAGADPVGDISARSWIVVTIGATALPEAVALLSAGAVEVAAETPGTSRDALEAAIQAARVGVRVLVTGPAADCLKVRGQLVSLGLEDDEIVVRSGARSQLDVWCSHCGCSTRAEAAIGDVVVCSGCGVGLQVYHHVSRLSGCYLGFDADAETVPQHLADQYAEQHRDREGAPA